MLSLNGVLMASRPTDPPTVTSPEIAGVPYDQGAYEKPLGFP